MIEAERRAAILARMSELERELRRLEQELETLDGAPLLAAGPFDMLLCRNESEFVGFVDTEVERVVQAAELSPATNAPAWILGLLNLHGELIPVLSIAARVGRQQSCMDTSDSIVITNTNSRRLGVLVQETFGMRQVVGGAICTAPQGGLFAPFIVGLVPSEEGLVTILSVERLMSPFDVTVE